MKVNPLNDDLISGVIDIARQAGFAIMEVYKTKFDIETKEDKRGDEIYRSPITEADKRAHIIIMEGLKKLTPDIPLLSEEGEEISFEAFKKTKRVKNMQSVILHRPRLELKPVHRLSVLSWIH